MSAQKLNNLIKEGYSHLQVNNVTQAHECFKEAKIIDPRNFDAWFALGNIYIQLNDLDQAVVELRKAIEISPENYLAHGQLGIALYRLQCLEEAIVCYRKVIDLQPDNAAAHANLAMVYIDIGQRENAVTSCLKAIELQPGFAGAHVLLASAYSALGDYEKSLKGYEDVLKIEPENISAVAGKADSLIKLGQKKEAFNVLKHKIDGNNIDPSIVTVYAAVSPEVGREAEAINYLEKSLKVSGLTSMQKLQLHFSAGSLYDRMEKYDDAFNHYSTGNSMVQRGYDSDVDRAFFDSIINTFNNKNMKQFPRAGRHDLSPVFIVGMPRSGTSLVERILGCHSSIFPAGELGEVPKLAERLANMCKGDNKFPECMHNVDASDLNLLSQEHLEYLTDISDACGIVTDKLPHNFLFLGLIELLFPNARIIHCKRDPLDTCLSNYFQYFSGPLDYPYDLTNIATHYNHYRRIMEHWTTVIQLPIFEVTYEELIHNQEPVTHNLLSFLELAWEDACLKFNESEHVTRTASYEQVREPLYTRSIGRWRHYEKYIGKLIENVHKH